MRRDAIGLDLAAPGGDQRGIGSGFQGGPVAGELAVALVQCPSHGFGAGVDIGLGVLQGGQGVLDAGRVERLGQPGVQWFQDAGLAQVHGDRVVELVGDGVLAGEAAPVVGLAVVPASLHAPTALGVEQDAGQGVAVPGPDHGPAGGGRSPAGQAALDLLEGVLVNDRGVRYPVGPHPGAGVVPAQLGFVAERDVFNVQECFGLVLLVPHLVAGVAGVGEDGADRALGPGDPGAVPVTGRVVGGRARDALGGQPFGERPDADAVDVVAEDPGDDGGGDRVQFQHVQPFAVGGLGWVGVRPGVDQPVPIRWPAAEVAAFDLGLGLHR